MILQRDSVVLTERSEISAPAPFSLHLFNYKSASLAIDGFASPLLSLFTLRKTFSFLGEPFTCGNFSGAYPFRLDSPTNEARLKRGCALHSRFDSQLVSILLSVACAAGMLTACGGGSDELLGSSTAKSTVGSRAPRPVKRGEDTFGNFNPDIWNEHNWYECSCGRNPDKPPTSMPWKAAN